MITEPRTDRFVRANGIDIHYAEAGTGEPLLLVDNAMVSSSPLWAGHPSAYATFLHRFAENFRVILPDTRGSGRTVHPGGPIPHTLLADDLLALTDALGLDRPAVCGFSDGGEVATILGIRHPDRVRAIVNHGGFDLFDPDPRAPSLMMTRQMLGGGPQATQVDFDAIAQLAARVDDLRHLFDHMRLDHDAAQGPGHWQAVLAQTYDRISQPHGFTIEDLRAVTAPTLLLVGDRDPFCAVEAAAAYARALPHGELAVVPATGHVIDEAGVDRAIDFLRRHH
jgi:pimeloyl-ACP methyl ester carboxylesterase